MRDVDGLDDLASDAAALESALSSSQSLAAEFEGELRQMRSTIADSRREVASMTRSISGGLRRSFEEMVFDGARLSDTLNGLADTIARATYRAAINPVANHFGGLLSRGIEGLVGGLLPFADGARFMQGRVVPFASGGIVSGPTAFPMRDGMGLMGEAGPEAIMPLARGSDGKLGVRVDGGGRPVTVVMNVSTPDVGGFARAEGQIASRVRRALSRADRNG